MKLWICISVFGFFTKVAYAFDPWNQVEHFTLDGQFVCPGSSTAFLDVKVVVGNDRDYYMLTPRQRYERLKKPSSKVEKIFAEGKTTIDGTFHFSGAALATSHFYLIVYSNCRFEKRRTTINLNLENEYRARRMEKYRYANTPKFVYDLYNDKVIP